ncbi:MAG: hypothetical protein PF690_18675 [Deltaproteobacteria bacterium]|jgi:DNA excision repair protein ERCC-4|nr:hypothetical protein [Deltaproteobacteria bacterium]
MNDLIKISILTDTREQAPYLFKRWNIKTQETGLTTGDYSLPGFEDKAAIERKTLDDLIGCLMGKDRERFEKELSRARSFELFAVVVEANLSDIANGQYQSNMKPTAALQTLAAFFIRYRVPFLFCSNRAGGEYQVYSLLQKYIQEIEKRFKQSQKHNQEVME